MAAMFNKFSNFVPSILFVFEIMYGIFYGILVGFSFVCKMLFINTKTTNFETKRKKKLSDKSFELESCIL